MNSQAYNIKMKYLICTHYNLRCTERAVSCLVDISSRTSGIMTIFNSMGARSELKDLVMGSSKNTYMYF